MTTYTLAVPPPDSITVEVIFTLPSGAKCVRKERFAVPYPCGWESERNSHHGDSTKTSTNNVLSATTALLVAPNPASGQVTISYDYGSSGNTSRSLYIYDVMGRKMDYTMPTDTHGAWTLNINNWAAGIYIIRMEGDGQVLQTQRMVISH